MHGHGRSSYGTAASLFVQICIYSFSELLYWKIKRKIKKKKKKKKKKKQSKRTNKKKKKLKKNCSSKYSEKDGDDGPHLDVCRRFVRYSLFDINLLITAQHLQWIQSGNTDTDLIRVFKHRSGVKSGLDLCICGIETAIDNFHTSRCIVPNPTQS